MVHFLILVYCLHFSFQLGFPTQCLNKNSYHDLNNHPCAESLCKSSCEPNRFGNHCEKENIALNKPTSQSSTYSSIDYGGPYPARFAVDGNTDNGLKHCSCSHTDDTDTTGAWWKVTLSPHIQYNISHITVYFRDENTPSMLARNDGLKVMVNNQTCYTQQRNSKTELHINCRSMPGNEVSIHISGQMLSLCEVQIFVCSDGWFGNECDKQCQCRNTSEVCDKETGYCRSGCRAGRQGDGCQRVCDDFSFGMNCMSTCGHCAENIRCNETTGFCENGCKRNFGSKFCNSCIAGKYGLNCSKSCGQCRNNSECHQTTGHCPNGCKPGYIQPQCKEECVDYTYGDNCSGVCSCLNQCEVCDKVTGSCHTGYQPTTSTTSTTLTPTLSYVESTAAHTCTTPTVGLSVMGSSLAATCICLAFMILTHMNLRRKFAKYKEEKDLQYSTLTSRNSAVYDVISNANEKENQLLLHCKCNKSRLKRRSNNNEG